jgi:hypothetical protein
VPTSADASDDPDILLARLLACRNRDELTALVRAARSCWTSPLRRRWVSWRRSDLIPPWPGRICARCARCEACAAS